MPRHRPLHRYPREYFECFERTQHEPWEMECEDTMRARYIRSDLYNLRAAVRAQCQLDPDNEALAEQYILMENIVIKQDDNILRFSARRYKNETHIAQALSKKDITDSFK